MAHVVSFNAGSSSLKYAAFDGSESGLLRLGSGAVDRIGPGASHLDAVRVAFTKLLELGVSAPAAVGHRLVHGGPLYAAPTQIDPQVRARLDGLVPFAPLHLPHELAVIDAVSSHFRGAPQIACFDTAFHRSLPEVARRLPIARALFDDGVRRYGFHGLSYEYVLDALGAMAAGRVIVCHLGSGASMVAVQDGRSVDTTMGLTPIGGLMMGTRSGDLDPGVLLYLLESRGYERADIRRLVNEESGLRGVSGTTSDMKALLEARGSDPAAGLAVDMFCYAVRKSIGAFAAALGGLDALVFTGGIGEHSAEVRAQVCEGLGHLGVRVDHVQNASNERVIGAKDGPVRIYAVPTDEEQMIARHTWAILQGKDPPS